MSPNGEREILPSAAIRSALAASQRRLAAQRPPGSVQDTLSSDPPPAQTPSSIQISANSLPPENEIMLIQLQQSTDLLQSQGRQSIPVAQYAQGKGHQTSQPTYQALPPPTDRFGPSKETARNMEMTLIEPMQTRSQMPLERSRV